MTKTEKNKTELNFKKVKRDINGNPRYVIHFLDLLENEEQENIDVSYDYLSFSSRLKIKKDLALKKARLIGGKLYRGKEFSGGIVFQSYNVDELIASIQNFAKPKKRISWCNGRGKNKFSRSKDNLSYDDNGNVYSYSTHVACIIDDFLVCRDKYYSRTTNKHLGIASLELNKKRISEFDYYNLYQ